MTDDGNGWVDSYKDMSEIGMILGGVRVGVGVDEHGRKAYSFKYDNIEQLNGFEVAGMLEQMKRDLLDGWMSDFIERTGEER